MYMGDQASSKVIKIRLNQPDKASGPQLNPLAL